MDISNYKNIILLTGAGVSTLSGIPDYKTDRSFIEKDDLSSLLDNCQPNINHEFALKLYQKGVLKRIYTQNIDRLYHKIGIPDDKIVECHGNYIDGIIGYGCALSNDVYVSLINDFLISPEDRPDLLLVMGTRLQVAPVCAIPNLLKNIDKFVIINDKNDVLKNSFKNCNNGGFNNGGFVNKNYITLSYTNNKKKIKRKVSLQAKWKKYQILEMPCEDYCTSVIF